MLPSALPARSAPVQVSLSPPSCAASSADAAAQADGAAKIPAAAARDAARVAAHASFSFIKHLLRIWFSCISSESVLEVQRHVVAVGEGMRGGIGAADEGVVAGRHLELGQIGEGQAGAGALIAMADQAAEGAGYRRGAGDCMCPGERHRQVPAVE